MQHSEMMGVEWPDSIFSMLDFSPLVHFDLTQQLRHIESLFVDILRIHLNSSEGCLRFCLISAILACVSQLVKINFEVLLLCLLRCRCQKN